MGPAAALLAVAAAALWGLALARCPNSCSGHGQCGLGNVCTCYDGWNGGATDCSLRLCPNGTAWVDKAYATDSAHQLAECSNAGECNRQTGMCQCFPGFTGVACQRSSCPNDCSSHGFCSTIGDVSLYDGPDYDPSVALFGDGFGPNYLNWDKDAIQMCECEEGYIGPDCSLVMCPRGDDPLTVNQNYRQLRLKIESVRDFPDSIVIEFHGTKVTFAIFSQTAATCGALFSFIGKFGEVGCAVTYYDPTTIFVDLTFYSWPARPTDNNLFVNDGNPPISDFHCVIPAAAQTTCVFQDVVASNVREFAICSNRGKCDFSAGVCQCLDGFGGPACANATFLYSAASDSTPGLAVSVQSLNFTSTALQLTARRAKGTDFYFMEAFANNERVFYVQGDGSVGVNKLLTLSGGHTISGAGLNVESGGCTIAAGGLNVISDDPTYPALKIASTYPGALNSVFANVQLSSLSTTAHNFIQGMFKGRVTFSVSNYGGVSIPYAGLYVSSGLTVNSGGMQVTGGATIHTGGLSVEQGGAVVTGGLTVATGGVSIDSGGLQVYGGGSVYSGGMRITGGATVNSGGLAITGGASVLTSGLVVTGGVTVNSGGMLVTGGVTVHTGGLLVSSGGLTVSLNGVVVTGGLSVLQGGLQVTNGVTVYSDGLRVTGGLTVHDSGVAITGGLTVVGSVVVSAGLQVQTLGAAVTGGLTVYGSGLNVAGSVTIASGSLGVAGSLLVTSGLSVGAGGATVAGGVYTDTLTATGDMTVLGKLDVNSLYVTNGMTVYGATNLVSVVNVFSDRRLKTNLAPITGALDKVTRLKGLYFDWVSDEVSGMKMDRRRQVGVLAQDVRRVLPEVVRDDHGQYLSVDYPALVPLLIEAIRDLQQEVRAGTSPSDEDEIELAALRAEMDALRRQGEDLQVRVDQLQAASLPPASR